MTAAAGNDPTRRIRLAAKTAARRRCLELRDDEAMDAFVLLAREDGSSERRPLNGVDARSTLGAAGAAIESVLADVGSAKAAAVVVPDLNGEPGRELVLVAVAGSDGTRQIYSARRDGRRLSGFIPGPTRPWITLADARSRRGSLVGLKPRRRNARRPSAFPSCRSPARRRAPR